MAYIVILLATLARFIPHAWDFSPVYGALLFGGANMKKRDSIWFSALTLGASNFVLTKLIYHLSFGWWTEPIQMAAFASIAMIGWVLHERFSIKRLAFACLAAPTAFYIISNFGAWLEFGSYPRTWAGLAAYYVDGIPFQGRITVSTVLFSVILFGGQRIYLARIAARKQEQALAR
jgi:hypothetical protein